MTLSLASVTIAYNASASLPRQLTALLNQTHSLQEIIVVDNASTDSTRTLLASRYPQVTVLRMAENVGAAGAWAAGLSYAAGKRHDWVWTFDDDSVPDVGTLEALLQGLKMSGDHESEIGMLAPMPVHRVTGTLYPPLLWREGVTKPTAEQMRLPIWFADITIASGSMVRGDLVKKIGLPRADFFMDVFDFEYCLRIKEHGYKIAVVNAVEFGHEVGGGRKINLPGYKRLWTNQPPWREYYISRNLTHLAWRLYPSRRTKQYIVRYLVTHLVGVLLFSSKKSSCVLKIAQGFGDGLRGRMGVRFRPDITVGSRAKILESAANNSGTVVSTEVLNQRSD
jgi:GT2 family glycosyltransferase